MEKSTESKTEPKSDERGWSEGRRKYVSADGVDIRIASRVSRLRQNNHSGNSNQTVLVNMVMHKINRWAKWSGIQWFASE